MYEFVPLRYDEMGYVISFPYHRPYPPNFFTRKMLGASVNLQKGLCIFIDQNTDKVNMEEYPCIPNFSLSVCKIGLNKECAETAGEPLFVTTLEEVLDYINNNY